MQWKLTFYYRYDLATKTDAVNIKGSLRTKMRKFIVLPILRAIYINNYAYNMDVHICIHRIHRQKEKDTGGPKSSSVKQKTKLFQRFDAMSLL
jgi:hypothetical protein